MSHYHNYFMLCTEMNGVSKPQCLWDLMISTNVSVVNANSPIFFIWKKSISRSQKHCGGKTTV